MKKPIDTTEFILKTLIRILLLSVIAWSLIEGFLEGDSWLRWNSLLTLVFALPFAYVWLELLFNRFPGKKSLVIIFIVFFFGLVVCQL